MADIKITVDKAQLDALYKLSQKVVTNMDKIGKSLSAEATSKKKVDEQLKLSQKVQKDTQKAWADTTRIITTQNDALIRARTVRNEEALSAKRRITVAHAEKTSYEAVNAAMLQDIASLKKLSAEELKSARGQVLVKSIQKKEAALRKLDALMGRHQRNVGNYGTALRGVASSLMGAFGVVGGVYMFARVLSNAVKVAKDFEKSNAVLASVLNKTTEQISGLTEQAIQLNRVTVKTADEITNLQIAYSRLGFSQEKIMAFTESTINTSIALNSELSDTAELVGSVAKAYKVFDKEGATRIMDQLVKATQNSSLNFERLKTALPKVAGAAHAAGIPLNTLLARLSVINDATLDASITGTSYRKILTDLAGSGLSYSESLDKILVSSDKVSTAKELFGQRAFVAGIALAENKEKVEELAAAYDDPFGTAARTAATQIDTLAARIDLLRSSWQGLILDSADSSSGLSRIVSVITEMVDIGGGMSGLDSGVKRFTPQLAKLTNAYMEFGDELKNILSLEEYLAQNFEDIGGGIGATTDEILKEWLRLQNGVEGIKNEFDGMSLVHLEHSLQVAILAYYNAISNNNTEEALRFWEQTEALKEQIKIITEELKRAANDVPAWDKTHISRLLGLDQKDKLIPAIDEIEQKLKDLEETGADRLEKIMKGDPIELAEMTGMDKIWEDAEEGGVSYFQMMEDLTVQLGQSLQEMGQKFFVDQFNGIIDDNLEKFRDSEESKQDILKNRLDKGIISEKQYDREVKASKLAIRREEAKAEKKKALFQIAIDTAVAVMKVFAAIPFPLGIKPAALVGAIGLAQATAVAAQPIPRYDKGTTNFPGTGWVGEKRPEIIELKGVKSLIDKPTLFSGNQYKGMKVIGGAATEKLARQNGAVGFDDSRIVTELQKQALRPVKETNVTASGLLGMTKAANLIKYNIQKF